MTRSKLLAAIAVIAIGAGTASMAQAQGTATSSDTAAVTTSSSGGMAQATPAKLSHMTKNFIKSASGAGMFEVETSRVALTKSSNQQIKDFAQKMIDDHTKAGDALKSIASSSPDEQALLQTSLDSSSQKKLDKLNKDDAASFDKDYVSMQVDAHDDAVKLFDKYSKKGDDPALKSFATQTLPTLQGHKQMIDGIKASMK